MTCEIADWQRWLQADYKRIRGRLVLVNLGLIEKHRKSTVPFWPTLHPLWPVTAMKRWASLRRLRCDNMNISWPAEMWPEQPSHRRQANFLSISSVTVVTCDRRVGRNSTVYIVPAIWPGAGFKNGLNERLESNPKVGLYGGHCA